MRTLVIFGSYLAYVFIVGSFIAYPLYELVQFIFPEGSYIAEKPFGKVANRGYMLVAAIGLYPLWKAFDCQNKKDLGFDISKPDFFKETKIGLVYGIFSLVALAFFIVILGIRPLEDDATFMKGLMAVIKFIPGALALAFIEEIFFRGILLRSMSRTLSPVKAIIITSIIFSSVHFLRNKTDGTMTELHWLSGFEYLNTTLVNYTDPKIIGSWLTLFACGVFLSFISLHHGNIARCIGVHLGWVLILRIVKKLTDDDQTSPYFWMVGSYDKITGYLSFFIITIMCFSLWFFCYRKKPTPA